ncbi:SMI1/KNR4 family protein [Chitinimonas lacunae]|uniref:SMI1/KNR4 family protein n=1 Tax=Chitinimonas lacunae TaxID=1963018 RepID=A0ABV8MMF2_9NEIS
MNWPEEIAILVFVKEELAKVDKKGWWSYHFPEVAASRTRLSELEKDLGCSLDPQYASFLLYADGWQGFYQTVDLFGCNELSGNKKMQQALELLRATEDGALEQAGITREDVIPIAATSCDKDIFLLAKPHTSIAGTVLWFAGEEIDRFENFDEFFLAMVDYNREEVFSLRGADDH